MKGGRQETEYRIQNSGYRRSTKVKVRVQRPKTKLRPKTKDRRPKTKGQRRKLKFLMPINSLLLAIVFIVSALLVTVESTAPKKTAFITVAAGSFDRRETVVSFNLPAELSGSSYSLRDEANRLIPLQIDALRRATFVLSALNAGESRNYRIVTNKPKAGSAVELTRQPNSLELKVAGQPAFSFVTTPTNFPGKEIKPVFLRGGYIHPIFSPSGRLVTDDYPSDHYHHHGIWFAWTKTEFEGGRPDFWNVADGTGRVEFEAVNASWNGPVHAGFKSQQRYVALTGAAPKTALNEEWDVRLYNVGQTGQGYFMFDIVATQQCATSSPLILEEYRYGGMGVRGHRDWKDKSKVTFLTSEGKSRSDGNATRGRWCHISGPVDGQVAGIAILDHPDNFRAPQPMRLNPDDPFFNYAPSQLGRFEIKPGEKLVLRYRYVVADGSADVTRLNRWWNDYASPPEVSITLK